MENWKIINDFQDYEVSDFGNVRNIKTQKILKPFKCYNLKKPGYERYKVKLFKNKKGYKKYIHQLVARAFLEIPKTNPDGTLLDLKTLQINHKDCNTSNNNVLNLEWCDSGYNNRSREQAKPIKCVETNEIFPCAFYAAEKYGVSISHLQNTANPNDKGKKTAAGYHWTYNLNLTMEDL